MCIIVDGSTDFQQEVGEKAEEIKPTSIPVDFGEIPAFLKGLNLWVEWAYVWKDRRWTKMPFQPVEALQEYRDRTGWALYAAKSNRPDTWTDYETVAAFHERHPTLTDGIGVMLQEGLSGDDLDKCRDRATGEVSGWALDLVRRGDCYTEVSPSRTGLKMFMMADLEAVRSLPEFAGRRSLRKQAPFGTGRVEVYDKSSNRFFTVTGHRFGEVTTIEDRQAQFNDVYRTVFADIGKTKPEEDAGRVFDEAPDGRQPDWLEQICAEEDAGSASAWLKKFKGDLRTLDVMGLWRSAGLVIDRKDEETFAVQCPNRANHSDPEASGGTVIYKRPGEYPIIHCGRTRCRDGQFGTREAMLSFGPGLVDRFCKPFHPDGDEDGDLPEIITSDRQLPDLTMDAMKAIDKANDPPRLFRRSGAVVRLRRDDGPAYCEPLSVAALRGEMARAALWRRWSGSRDKAVKINDKPPREVVEDLLSHPGWRLPVIDQIVESPVFMADGLPIDRPGYHPDCRLWYEPGPGLDRVHVPPHPTAEQVSDAVRLLNTDMLVDFPFVGDADRANCLAFYLLPAVRQMIVGNTPMHVFGATRQGTGKGRLVDLWGLIWLGRTPSLTSEPHSDKEWGEKIGSSLLSGAGHFFVDNIKYAVRSGALAVALTTSRFSYRILGESKVVDLPVGWCWGANANNVKADSDIVRRFVRTRLDANCERPELRSGWKIPDLLGWARGRRSELVSACLTIVRAWIVAGKPMGAYTLGSYEEWARVMGGILDSIGVREFLGNLSSNDEVNSAEAEWRGFVSLWSTFLRDEEVTIKELYELAIENDLLSGVMGEGSDMSQRTKLGLALGNREGQVWDGKKIVIPKDEAGRRRVHRTGGVLYRLVDIGDDPTGSRPSARTGGTEASVGGESGS